MSSVIDYAKKEGVPKLAGTAAYHATSFGLDCVIGAKSAQLLNKFAKIARSEQMGQFLQKAANILNKAPELEAVTVEGLAVKAVYAATSVAWDTVITGKSLHLMNKFAKIAHSKEMGQFLQKAPKLENATKILFNI